MVVRPAGIALHKTELANAAAVRDIRFLGDRHVVLLEAAGEVLRASCAKLPALRVGDRVVADFRAADAFVYVKASALAAR